MFDADLNYNEDAAAQIAFIRDGVRPHWRREMPYDEYCVRPRISHVLHTLRRGAE
jgi:hypothetical protein